MSTSVLVLVTSSSLLLLLLCLIFAEQKAGKVLVLSTVRTKADQVVLWGVRMIAKGKYYLGTGSIRIVFHYVVHTALAFVMRGLQSVETLIGRMQRQNRQTVRAIRDAKDKNHLDVLAEHKETSSLSEAKKAELKERSISGR